MADAGWTTARIANECGVHPRKIRRCLALMSAPKDVQDSVETGDLSMIAGLELQNPDPYTYISHMVMDGYRRAAC